MLQREERGEAAYTLREESAAEVRVQSAKVDARTQNFILKIIRAILTLFLKPRFENQRYDSRKSKYAPVYISLTKNAAPLGA